MTKPAFTKYNMDMHQSITSGYLNRGIVDSAAEHMATLVLEHRKIRQSVQFIVVDNSSCILAAATHMCVCKMSKVRPRLVFPGDPGKDKWGSKVGLPNPKALIVFVDDCLYNGTALKAANKWAGRSVDLAVCIHINPLTSTVRSMKLAKHVYDLQRNPTTDIMKG